MSRTRLHLSYHKDVLDKDNVSAEIQNVTSEVYKQVNYGCKSLALKLCFKKQTSKTNPKTEYKGQRTNRLNRSLLSIVTLREQPYHPSARPINMYRKEEGTEGKKKKHKQNKTPGNTSEV